MIEIGSQTLSLKQVQNILTTKLPVKVCETRMKQIQRIYEKLLAQSESNQPIYGVNTGFGALAEQIIECHNFHQLQKNLLLSHAVGVGEPMNFFESRMLLLLRLTSLAQGYSGASPQLIEALVKLLNANCAPLVPRKGSVGASGDLAPLAHLGLLLIGEGEAYIDEKKCSAKQALTHAGVEEISLGVRDGIALINGTQAMAAIGVINLLESEKLSKLADACAASSANALLAHDAPFSPRIHELKPFKAQVETARRINNALSFRKSEFLSENQRTQDPYSIRCIPQVHGASKDTIEFCQTIVEKELNSVTDNPLFFLNENTKEIESYSGGNFHGQYLAFALDFCAMAVAELGNISERRIELLLNSEHSNGLPPFLMENSGLNSGYMMLQVTASALVNENKILCHPASVDSIPTSAGREDHVSMGMTSANKLIPIIENVWNILAIEMLVAHQAINFRNKNAISLNAQKLNCEIRKSVNFRKEDALFIQDLEILTKFLKSNEGLMTIDTMFQKK